MIFFFFSLFFNVHGPKTTLNQMRESKIIMDIKRTDILAVLSQCIK